MSEDAGIEPRTVATLLLAARRSNHSSSFKSEASGGIPRSLSPDPEKTSVVCLNSPELQLLSVHLQGSYI